MAVMTYFQKMEAEKDRQKQEPKVEPCQLAILGCIEQSHGIILSPHTIAWLIRETISAKVQMWSVIPAAIAGVLG